MKVGVKGLLGAGVSQIPRIFHHPHLTLTDSHPSTMIPTIDLYGGVFESTDTRKSIINNIKEAVVKFGFFQAINHGIEIDVMEKMKDGVREFHEQDSEVKKKLYSRDNTKTFTYNSNFDLYSSPSANWRDTLSCFMSPNVPKTQDLPEICGFRNPNHLKEMDCTKGLLMLSHYYPLCSQPDLTFSTSQHSDRSFLTILLQDHIGGLQIRHNDNWVDVPPVPGALLINLGDLLQLITNDKFVTVEHRVLANRIEVPRTSVASFFMHPLPSFASLWTNKRAFV